MPTDHDSGYRYLFADPTMMRDLLVGFVPHEWVTDADFSTLERVSGSYVSDDLRRREEDMVWRLRLRGQWFYVYLLLEFQSRPDPWMALRMLVYVGLLHQDLVVQKQLGPDGRLPAVLPVVLYNGRHAWRAPDSLEALQTPSPPGLAPFRVQARYLLLDERRYTKKDLSLRNFVAALFRLERARSEEDCAQVIRHLSEWLKGDEHERLRRSFELWLKRRLRTRLPVATMTDPGRVPTLEEIETMFPDLMIREERKRARKEGRAEGRKEGLQLGELKGLNAGRQEAARAALLRLLERRFGPVSAGIRQRVESADHEAVRQWFDRAIDADEIESVFRQ